MRELVDAVHCATGDQFKEVARRTLDPRFEPEPVREGPAPSSSTIAQAQALMQGVSIRLRHKPIDEQIGPRRRRQGGGGASTAESRADFEKPSRRLWAKAENGKTRAGAPEEKAARPRRRTSALAEVMQDEERVEDEETAAAADGRHRGWRDRGGERASDCRCLAAGV